MSRCAEIRSGVIQLACELPPSHAGPHQMTLRWQRETQPREGGCGAWLPSQRRYCHFDALTDGLCRLHQPPAVPVTEKGAETK